MIKHLRNAGWSVAEGIGYPVLLMVATPVLLKTLGAADFGLWSLLITFMSAGFVVSIGTSAAVIKLVAEVPSEDTVRLGSVVQGGLAVAMAAGGVVALLVVGAALVFASTWFAKMGPPEMVMVTGLFAAALLWLEQLDIVISAVFKGREAFSLAARLEIALKLLQILLVVVVAVISHSLLAVYVVFAVMAVIRLLAKAWFLRARWPSLSLLPRMRFAKLVLNNSAWGWAQGLGSVVFSSVDRLVVGSVLGAVSLGYYSIGVQLASQMHALVASAFGIIVPRVSRHAADNEKAQHLRAVARRLMLLNLAAACFGSAVLAFGGEWLLRLWVGADTASHVAQNFPVLVVAYFFLTINIVPFHFLTGLGRMRYIALVSLAGGTVALLLNFSLVASHGLQGAALSRLGYALVALAFFIPLFWPRHRPNAVPTFRKPHDHSAFS